MNDKASRYNIEIEYYNGILLYNSLTNRILPISLKDYSIIETLMEHLPTFRQKFPELYSAFQRSDLL